MRLILDPRDLIDLKTQAIHTLPREACGLLIGRRAGADLTVARWIASANRAAPGRHDRFEIDTTLLLAEQRRAREAGLALLGSYHSHPDGMARPSDEDLEGAHGPNQVWLILAVGADRTVDVAAFWRGATARFEAMDVIERGPKA